MSDTTAPLAFVPMSWPATLGYIGASLTITTRPCWTAVRPYSTDTQHPCG